MFINRYKILLATIITILVTYIYLNPLAKTKILTKDSYILDTKSMNIKNHPPFFKLLNRYQDESKFFIHPGSKLDAKGKFKFNQDYLLKFKFSIQEGSPCGDIEYILKKNSKIIDKLIVTTNTKKSIKLKVSPKDKIEVIANSHGSTAGDWGNLEIVIVNNYLILKNLFIVLLWIIFFIFMFKKGYLYIAINSYLIFFITILAEKLNFGALQFETIFTYTLFLFLLTAIFILVFQLLKVLKFFKVATILNFAITFLVYIIPIISLLYFFKFEQQISKEILYAIFQTNKDESLEFITSYIQLEYILVLVLLILLTAILIYKQERINSAYIKNSKLITFIALLSFIISLNFIHLRMPNFTLNSWNEYYKELEKFRELEKKRQLGELKFSATKSGENETYIVVIGESLNKRHMGVYGYFRDTTPNLSKKLQQDSSLLVFNNAYANYVQTMPALSLALTEANQYNKKSFYNSLSIIDIFNKANFETYWITNQSILSEWDNFIAILANEANRLISFNHSIGVKKATLESKYDEVVIKPIKKILDKNSSKNRVIFVHLMGSHISYDSRYPNDKFSKYKGALDIKTFGKLYKNRVINIYDNSVYYNDYVINSILELLKNRDGIYGFIYFSDHGEDVINNLTHNPSRFTYEMIQIPMIAWFNKSYKNRYPKRFNELSSKKDRLFSNDLIYDTLIGITGVNTNIYNQIYDLSSSKYSLNPDEALAEHGKLLFTDKKNTIYWQLTNSNSLKKQKLIDKVVIDNVKTIGKLKELELLGFSKFKVDVEFKNGSFNIISSNKSYKFSLNDYLKMATQSKVKSIFIEIKNIDLKSCNIINSKVIELQNRYNINLEIVNSSCSNKKLIDTKLVLQKSNFTQELESNRTFKKLEQIIIHSISPYDIR